MTAIFDRLGDAVRRLFQTTPEKPARSSRRSSSRLDTMLETATRPDSGKEFEAALARALADHSNVAVGRVHLVNLTELRDSFGERWDEISDKAIEIVISCIKENIRTGDFYERHGETAFVVVLPNAREHEAAICLNRIRKAIGMKLLGDEEPGELVSVKSASVKTDGRVIFQPTKKIEDLIGFVEEKPASTLPPHMVRLLEEVENKEPTDPLEELRILYRPMWHVDRDTVSSYVMMPCREIARNQFVTGAALLPQNPTANMMAELDTLLVEAAADELTRLRTAGALMSLTVPVHLETLSAANLRQAYLRIVEGLLGPMKRLVVFEIHELTPGVPQSRLFDIVNYLSPHCRAVCCRFRPGAALEDSLQGSGIFACGLDIKGRHGEAEAIKPLFDQFISRCKGLGVRSYLHGAGDAPTADMAAQAGFTFVDGEAVEGMTRHPEAMHRFNRRDLYKGSGAINKEVSP